MTTLALLIVFVPFIAFAVHFALARKLPRQGDWFATGIMGLMFVFSLMVFFQWLGAREALEHGVHHVSRIWFSMSGGTANDFGFDPGVFKAGVYIDGLTATMLVVVTLVSFLVHLFSIGYMHGDAKYSNYFSWLLFFTGSMLGLVVSDNLICLYMFWELVGLASYKLIGFWSEKDDPMAAAKKAFMTTRVGDVGMFIAIMIIHVQLGSVNYSDIFEAIRSGALVGDTWVTIAALGLFLGAMGKSAQFPLHVWLPDAMEGPTPVSALIHAATMVAAGVYLVGRMFLFFSLSTTAMHSVAWIGAITAIFAASIAITSTDIKKVLAYSTVSQLGYMVLGLGVGCFSAALFHLVTHAFFKALMFLGSGSVIHAVHSQEMGVMGGLKKKMPITYWTFLAGVLSISGMPFLAGFFSKDAILAGAHAGPFGNPVVFWMGVLTAAMTSFYMFRLFFLTFHGTPRDQAAHDHAHESPPTMWIPLAVLAVLAVCAGWGHWNETVLPNPAGFAEPHSGFVMTLAISAFVVGLAVAAGMYLKPVIDRVAWRRMISPIYAGAKAKWFVDEVYEVTLIKPCFALARFFRLTDEKVVDGAVNATGRATVEIAAVSGAIDREIVDGLVRGTGETTLDFGEMASQTQSGRIRSYVLAAVTIAAIGGLLVLYRQEISTLLGIGA